MRTVIAAACLFLLAGAAHAAPDFTVAPVDAADEKAVFATVESVYVVPARVRTAGTITMLAVKEGDRVKTDQRLAMVADQKLILQQGTLDAQIAGLKAQLAQSQVDLARTESLFRSGVASRSQFDQLTTAVNVATNMLKARNAERAVLEQQMAEGEVLAPTAGLVLKVPVTVGSVVMSGEDVAVIAQSDFVLRLRVPERHAAFLKAGDRIRLAEPGAAARFGAITLVYPQIQDGRVMADAKVDGLGDYFVGQRVRVWISGGERKSVIVPAAYIVTRFGLDYARLRQPGGIVEAPVQRGREQPQPTMPDALEILSGLQAGDVLVAP
jgi:RND family efflux transporter MFP subunit